MTWVERTAFNGEHSEATGRGGVYCVRAALEDESRRILDRTGLYPFVVAEDLGDGMVVITPSADWLRGAGDVTDDAWSLYRLWKAHNGGRPVTVAITDERGSIYITVQDTAEAPLLTVHH